MELKKYGVAGKDYENAELAKGDTYTRLDGSFPPTNLACKDNPYINELNTSKYILDFGCGVGRNLPWIMENTNAIYVGLDPNTTMTGHFWEVQSKQGYNIEAWKDRVIICNSFDEIPSNVKFDYIVSTFVLQHLGYRYSTPGTMNLTNITQNIFKHINNKVVWFAIEHDSEENWIPKWVNENGIKLDVYIRSYMGLPELNDRDNTAPNGGHHLMIFKYENNL
jgi:SAM-dependent methyltransferase